MRSQSWKGAYPSPSRMAGTTKMGGYDEMSGVEDERVWISRSSSLGVYPTSNIDSDVVFRLRRAASFFRQDSLGS
jgi:hypothetical protein